MATSTALKAFMQAPREQRVTALRSLGAEKMVQLEGELREARLTLFGPLPASKSGKAPLTSPLLQALCHRQSSALPKSPLRPRRSQSPHRQKTPPPPAAPHHGMARRTANAKPRVALPIQPRTAKKLEDQMIQHRIAKSLGTGPTNKARERDASGQDISDADEWDEIRSSDAAPSSAPPAQHPAPHPAPHPAQQPGNLDLGWAAFYKASPRQGPARPSKHSTGPHPPPFPGPPPRDGPTRPQPPPPGPLPASPCTAPREPPCALRCEVD